MSRNAISTTGLIASPKRKVHRRKLTVEHNLSKCAISKPVQFSLRPFDGLFNPYSKSCSILCNHPGPNEVKTVVKQVKEQCIADTKAHYIKEDEHLHRKAPHDYNTADIADPNFIPEEFFRRYTGSDSRPLTPTPTVVSGRTRTSGGSQYYYARRCFTPDPIKNFDHERKQIVLDLRRSHSQETFQWNALSEVSPALLGYDAASKGSGSERSMRGVASGPARSKNMRLCEQEMRKKSAERKAQQQKEAEMKANTVFCINELDSVDVEGTDGKRHRRKKKKSKGTDSAAYHVSQEPETQIAAMGPDSPNASARPSLIPGGINVQQVVTASEKKLSSKDINPNQQTTFLTDDTMKILKRGLDISIVESAFTKYMHRALEEVFRYVSSNSTENENEALRLCKENITLPNVDNERWLSMPRKYTRNSTRFTLPIKTSDLATLTPFQYVSRHVWISDHRKQLYQYVFNKFVDEPNAHRTEKSNEKLIAAHRTTPPGDIDKNSDLYVNRERVMEFKHLNQALALALGFQGKTDKIDKIKDILLLNANDIAELNFRSWCGVVAFTERYLNDLPIAEDNIDEVEVADFESLERRFSYIEVPAAMKYILHFLKYNER